MRNLLSAIFIAIFTLTSINAAELQSLDKDLINYSYPYPVHFHEFESQQQTLRMAYMVVKATKPNGKDIVLMHGKNFNGAYWRETIKSLTSDGYRVIVPDQIGFGKSTKPKYYQYTFEQLAHNTHALLKEIGVTKTAVVGHSMGGMLATRFALMYPEMTEKLILANPIGLEDYQLFSKYRSIDLSYEAELKKTYEKIKAYQLKFYYDNQWKPAYDEWTNLLAGWTINEDYPIIAWNAALTYDMIFTQPVVYEFKNIDCPVLLILGTRDRTALGRAFAPKELQPLMGRYDSLGENTLASLKRGRLIRLEGIGHLPHIEAFDQFIKPLKTFLKQYE